MDFRGSISLLGFATPFIAVASFPAQVAPFFVVIAEDREDAEEPPEATQSLAKFSIQVESPEGATLFHIEQIQEAQRKPFQTMPGRLQMLAQIPVSVQKPGRFKYHLKVTRLGEETPTLSVTRELNVVAGEDVLPANDLAR
jgi:hypothetical protein